MLPIGLVRFKLINDTDGHRAGDRVLQSVVRILNRNVPKVDYVARIGGEEFAAFFPLARAEGVQVVAERPRQSVEKAGLPREDQYLRVTVGIGGAVIPNVVGTDEVYLAKRKEPNRTPVMVDGQTMLPSFPAVS